MLKSFLSLHSTGLGFNTSNLLTAQIDLRDTRYDAPQARRQVVAALTAAASSTPDVESAFTWSPSRLGDGNWMCFVTRDGFYEIDQDSRIEASRHYVLPGAIRQLGIPLLEGRDFTSPDDEDAPGVAIVSQSLAMALWPAGNPVGKRLEVGGFTLTRSRFEVIGVAADARHRMRLEEPNLSAPQEDIYFSFTQQPQRSISLLLRAHGGADPGSIFRQARIAVRQVDPYLPLYDMAAMEERLSREERRSRFSALVVGAYALLALALSAIGLYGVLSHLVGERTREIGIRIAVGADRGDIMWIVLGFGMKVTAVGLLAGLALAAVSGELLSSLLFGVKPSDPLIFGLVALFLAAVALPACYIPARRAVRIEPTQALRDE